MQVQNEVKQDEFRVGDVVWCLGYGKGVITKILELPYDYTFPVEVDFESVGNIRYTLDGKIDECAQRTLFFSEPKIEASVTRPFVPTLVGKRVVVQYCDGAWHKPVVVTAETEEEIFTKNGSDYKSDVIAIHEVSSENLLTSKK